jgi:hypothetical protein
MTAPYHAGLLAEILHHSEGTTSPQMEVHDTEWQRHFEYLVHMRALELIEGSSPHCYRVTDVGRVMLGRLHSVPRTYRHRRRSRV